MNYIRFYGQEKRTVVPTKEVGRVEKFDTRLMGIVAEMGTAQIEVKLQARGAVQLCQQCTEGGPKSRLMTPLAPIRTGGFEVIILMSIKSVRQQSWPPETAEDVIVFVSFSEQYF